MWNHKHDAVEMAWRFGELVFAFLALSWTMWWAARRGPETNLSTVVTNAGRTGKQA